MSYKKTRKGKYNVKMQPLTDVFKLVVLDYAPELDEEKKAAFGKYWHGDQAFIFI